MIDVTNIESAATAIDPVFTQSKQYISSGLGKLVGTDVLVKLESENPIGSFKGRGVDWFIQNWSGGNDLVTASAGNFGQAVGYCCSKRGFASHVFSSTEASPIKVDAMRRFGASVHLSGNDFDAAKEEGLAFSTNQGFPFIEDGKEPRISEGAGTIGVELIGYERSFDWIFIPIGNGALISGLGAYVKAYSPETRIIGVCAEAAPSMYLSWQEGKAVETNSANTIADGIACRVPVPESLEPVFAVVDDIVLVTEKEIVAAMLALKEFENLEVEPAGAVSLAGAMTHGPTANSDLIATIVTGTNVSPDRFAQYVSGA